MRFKLSTLMLAATLAGAASVALAKAPALHFAGEISKLDLPGKTLVVKEDRSPAKEMKFSLASDAKIMDGTHAKALADLKQGDHVKVDYTAAGNRNEAHRIDLASASAGTSTPTY